MDGSWFIACWVEVGPAQLAGAGAQRVVVRWARPGARIAASLECLPWHPYEQPGLGWLEDAVQAQSFFSCRHGSGARAGSRALIVRGEAWDGAVPARRHGL